MFTRLNRITVAGSIILAFLGAIYHSFATKLSEERALFLERGQLHSSMLRNSIGTALEIADGLNVAARNILTSSQPPASAYPSLLEKMPDRNAYGLFGLRAPTDPDTSLNLTGLGSLPVEPSRRQEIEAALALEPIFRWVKGIYPETPWVYYLSRQRFMCVYPYIPFDDFFMEDSFYDMDLFRRGTPENNPGGKPYITDVYVDEAGKGLMVTVGAPVYRGDEFMGIVGFDLTLEALSRSLQLGPLAGDSVYLVDDQAQIIASAGRNDAGETALSILNSALFEFAKEHANEQTLTTFGDTQLHVAKLPGVSWMLIAEKPNWDVYRAAAASTVPLIAFLLVMLAGMAAYLKAKRQQEEMESKQSLERFRSLLDATIDMIAVIEPASGRFLDGNKAICEFLGLTLQEFLTKYVFEISTLVSSEPQWQRFVEELVNSDGLAFEDRVQRPDGETGIIEVNAHCAKEGGQQYVIAVVRDITSRKQAEDERDRLQHRLQQTQKMGVIGQLTSGVAHDFNNILASMLGFSELARDQAGDNKKLKEYLELVLRSGERARQLIRRLLFFSRGDTRKTAGSIVLAAQMAEIVSMLKPMLSARIDVQTDLSESELKIRMDPVHLQQLLMNLSINARDAMPTGGVLKISVGQRMLNGEECCICHQGIFGNWVCISVRDTGEGISADLLERIFEPFFTTREAEEGMGMGLAIVQGIVRTYGGHVLIDSGPGRGTRFDILFKPATTVPPEAGPSPERSAPLGIEGKRILVVDDEPIIRLYFEEVLSLANAQVTSCASGAEALRQFDAAPHGFDLIITDQTMPGGSGVDLIREIRKLNRDVPVFLHSGYPDAVDPQDVARYKITKVLLKPSTADELTRAINDAIGL